MEVVAGMREVGVDARIDAMSTLLDGVRIDALMSIDHDGSSARFAVKERTRAPYPNELQDLQRLRDRLVGAGVPLLVAPFVSESVGRVLVAGGWCWADASGNFDLRAHGLLLRQRMRHRRPPTKARFLPRGEGSLSLIRLLIRLDLGSDGEGAGTSAIASMAGVSQPRASQVLAKLLDLGLAERRSGTWVADRSALLDRFLAEYRGPGGSERYFYSLDPPGEVARRAMDLRVAPRSVVVSGDVAADLLASWRRPSTVVLYIGQELDLGRLGVVEAHGRHDANVIVREPADRSVFGSWELAAQLHDAEISLADESQIVWDLQDLGGADREEWAGELRTWIVNH